MHFWVLDVLGWTIHFGFKIGTLVCTLGNDIKNELLDLSHRASSIDSD